MRERSSGAPSSTALRAPGSSRRPPISIARLERRGRVAAAAAQDGADARDHLGRAERLDHVVVGAQLETDDAVGLRAARGEHDDRHGRLAPQLAADLAPVAVRQRDVEQDEARVAAAEELQRGARRRRDDRLEALALERARERLGDRALVLDEQDRGSAGARASGKGNRRDTRIRAFGRTFTARLPGAWAACADSARDLISDCSPRRSPWPRSAPSSQPQERSPHWAA